MAGYKTKATDAFFYHNSKLVEREIDFSCTVSFTNLVDLSNVEAFRKEAAHESRPTYTAFVAKAVAMALVKHPYANRRFYRPFGIFRRRMQTFSSVDIAIASETNIPNVEYIAFIDVIRNVEIKELAEITSWLQTYRTETALNRQWREFSAVMTKPPKIIGKFLIALPVYFPKLWTKYRGGAVLISSPAKYGVDTMNAAWPAPLGFSFGFVKDRVIAKEGVPTVAKTFHLVLNFDRRLMAGAPAARFFAEVVQILETWPTGASNRSV
jgi:pyruvate/2-oxoglutarate dehydrogenase complex dihydrolipoamide acyltransferase (E2) component